MLRISNYATASTDSAAYIIGGRNGSWEYVSTIAEYKNNKWRKIGNLNEPKSKLSAIFNNGEYIVVGGRVEGYSGRWAFSEDLDNEQFNTFILGSQLKFGISKRDLLEQPIHLKEGNIKFLFCSVSIRTFAFKYEFR